MNSALIPGSIKDHLIDALSLTHDGIGIFDANDILVYCNDTLASMFSMTAIDATGMSFDSLIEHNFNTNTGLNIESDSLSDWLEMAHGFRRSEKFRRFEVDFCDSRYFLVTEHTADDNSMLIFCSDITVQKRAEVKLLDLNRQLSILAHQDSLTGIYNRRYFYQRVESELSRCIRQKLKASVLMIDLDHFKNINDNFGHEGGDTVLIETANLIGKILRDYDIFGRVGGEEFAIFLPGTGLKAAKDTGTRILKQIRQFSFSAPVHSIKVTVSIGVAATNHKRFLIKDLFRDADRLLYQAKNEGRDRLIAQQ